MDGPLPRVVKFAGFELDPHRFELRSEGERVHVEPQVLSLILLLAANRDRMVTKDEIIEAVWDGRIVSESAISARIKAARKVLGDDGKAQRVIRTIHGRGFRFVADVCTGTAGSEPTPTLEASSGQIEAPPPRSARPSIAVLPFELVGEEGPHDIIADALPADIIMDLARINWLFVISRGSSFRFRGADSDPAHVGAALNVHYCLTGTIERSGHEVIVWVALVDTRDGQTVWSERYTDAIDRLQDLRPEIERRVVESVLVQIPQNEVRLARGLPVAELDAWASFHLGIDHMYRFNSHDNTTAAFLFNQALERDPYFSRAMAGLSFSHFQSAFMSYDDESERHVEMARSLAQRAVETDRLDPFAHFSVGRCSWLEGRLDDSISWFDSATSLSPSFAQGIYNRGLVSTIAGKAEAADRDLALALELSPLDPMAYAMISSRALTHLQFGDYEKAAEFGERAALTPGAHKHIKLIAGLTLHLAGRGDEAKSWLARARADDAEISSTSFFRSFPFPHNAPRETIERGLRELGF
ncbi:winged helix-turn-helix domain-containing protein [Qipengyuania sp. 1NDW9]|uniref:Winged helix-turn-helix domain-containing protein n=1 Tax=Qipengyuania xiapuensis TaxID=2867236 RepID=A0ABX8ZZ72_9SPHN|nr:winged helix-turn-helix domain-containing protein [Qipengyuania xiapuensis]MBX7493492.1 winged helix-turn-helix domain-containing protein [Qipengyuania xiapuensis]QZD92388.1 winged helix-turn-helix domain-containing protein [Qipengyuania xiapuensis]